MLTRIMPADLKVGDFFRLTGTADDPEEAADTSTYEVVDLDFRFMEVMGKQVLVGCTILTRRSPEESLFEMGVGPWVPLLRVEPS